MFFSRYNGVRVLRNFSIGFFPDNLLQLFFREWSLAVLSFLEVDLFYLQETSCFTTGCSGRFVDKLDVVGHGTLRVKIVQRFKSSSVQFPAARILP
jgi:hypothetical protein